MKIFVGGLLYDTQEEAVKEQFEKYGTVDSVILVADRKPGFNKGFGYVEMPDEEQATKAITELNGSEINGKKITVSIADNKVRPERKDNGNRNYKRW
jgi:RNA recognition motif-containing protein